MALIHDNLNLKFERNNMESEYFCHEIIVNVLPDGKVTVSPRSCTGRSITHVPDTEDYGIYSIEFTQYRETKFHVIVPAYSIFMEEDTENKAVTLKDLYTEHVLNGKMKMDEFNRQVLENVEW